MSLFKRKATSTTHSSSQPGAPRPITSTVDQYILISPDLQDTTRYARDLPLRTVSEEILEKFKKANLEEQTPVFRNIISTRSMGAREAYRSVGGSSARRVGSTLNTSFPTFSQLFGKSVYVFPSEQGWSDITRQSFGPFRFHEHNEYNGLPNKCRPF